MILRISTMRLIDGSVSHHDVSKSMNCILGYILFFILFESCHGGTEAYATLITENHIGYFKMAAVLAWRLHELDQLRPFMIMYGKNLNPQGIEPR